MTAGPWVWVSLVLAVLLAVALAILLWSARAQRAARFRFHSVEPLREDDRSALALSQARRSPGNRVEVFHDRVMFDELAECIGEAREHVHLLLYVWWKGDVCERFAELLAQKARGGLEVRLLVDAMGAWDADPRNFERIREAGGEVLLYHDVRLRTLGRLNKRSHRRIVVVDGIVAYVFGHGIAQEWDGPEGWRDVGVRVEGSAVRDLQGVFSEQWAEESGLALTGERYFPPLGPAEGGDVTLEVVASSPRGGISHMALFLQMRLAAAEREIWLQTPYFVPDETFLDLLCLLRKRGVEIRLMVPGREIDWGMIRHAAHRTFPRLLDAGVRIWECDRMVHQKTLSIDGRWSFVGTANLDDRSLDINAEIGVGVWSDDVARDLVDRFRQDAESCRRIDAEALASRSLRDRTLDELFYRLRELL